MTAGCKHGVILLNQRASYGVPGDGPRQSAGRCSMDSPGCMDKMDAGCFAIELSRCRISLWCLHLVKGMSCPAVDLNPTLRTVTSITENPNPLAYFLLSQMLNGPGCTFVSGVQKLRFFERLRRSPLQ